MGGQRSQRKKWLSCFDNVKAVLFITSLSEYDQVLDENPTVVRRHRTGTVGITNTVMRMTIPACWELAGIGRTRGTIYRYTFNKFTRIGFLTITISSDHLVRNG